MTTQQKPEIDVDVTATTKPSSSGTASSSSSSSCSSTVEGKKIKTILYSFKATDQPVDKALYLFEIKYSPPIPVKCKWFLASYGIGGDAGSHGDDGAVQLKRLEFQAMDADHRFFKDGSILDLKNLTYHYPPTSANTSTLVFSLIPCTSTENDFILNSLVQ